MQIPTAIVGEEDDGVWVIYNVNRGTTFNPLRPWYRNNNPVEKFAGTLHATGVLQIKTEQNVDPSGQHDGINDNASVTDKVDGSTTTVSFRLPALRKSSASVTNESAADGVDAKPQPKSDSFTLVARWRD